MQAMKKTVVSRMNRIFYECHCLHCSWSGLFEIGNPSNVVYHEPVGKDVIRVVSQLPDCCPACGAEITSERKEMEIRN